MRKGAWRWRAPCMIVLLFQGRGAGRGGRLVVPTAAARVSCPSRGCGTGGSLQPRREAPRPMRAALWAAPGDAHGRVRARFPASREGAQGHRAENAIAFCPGPSLPARQSACFGHCFVFRPPDRQRRVSSRARNKEPPPTMPPRRPGASGRPPHPGSASVGALLNRAQDTASAAAHGKLAPHLWAHLSVKGLDAFWEELVACVDYLLTITPVRALDVDRGGVSGPEEPAARGGIEKKKRRGPRRRAQCGPFASSAFAAVAATAGGRARVRPPICWASACAGIAERDAGPSRDGPRPWRVAKEKNKHRPTSALSTLHHAPTTHTTTTSSQPVHQPARRPGPALRGHLFRHATGSRRLPRR
jgi:hypothetical protein